MTTATISAETIARLDALVADGLIDSYLVEPIHVWKIITSGPIMHVEGTATEARAYVERYAPMKHGWTAEWSTHGDGPARHLYVRSNSKGRVLHGYEILLIAVARPTRGHVIDLAQEDES
jgi:hypothetical protein